MAHLSTKACTVSLSTASSQAPGIPPLPLPCCDADANSSFLAMILLFVGTIKAYVKGMMLGIKTVAAMLSLKESDFVFSVGS